MKDKGVYTKRLKIRNQLKNPRIRVPKLGIPEVIQSQQKSAAWALKSQEVDFPGLLTMMFLSP